MWLVVELSLHWPHMVRLHLPWIHWPLLWRVHVGTAIITMVRLYLVISWHWRHFCTFRWITALACGMLNVPSYFRLCPNLVASSLWHWWHKWRWCPFRSHLTFLVITHIVGRLTVLVILMKLLVSRLFHCWFG